MERPVFIRRRADDQLTSDRLLFSVTSRLLRTLKSASETERSDARSALTALMNARTTSFEHFARKYLKRREETIALNICDIIDDSQQSDAVVKSFVDTARVVLPFDDVLLLEMLAKLKRPALNLRY